MQDVNFKTIDELMEYLPEDELKITTVLRDIVLREMPECTEKLSFNVPFYNLHYNVCFIWPGSIAWGKVKNAGVRFGFAKGYLMEDEINYLDKGNRKQVFWRDYFSVKDIDISILRSYIYQAILIDEQLYRQKKGTKLLKGKRKTH